MVTAENVALGMRVRRNQRDWRNKWRDDHGGLGTVVGYTDAYGRLVGANAPQRFASDRFNLVAADTGPDWAVVEWFAGCVSVYPIGAAGPLGTWWRGGPCFSLIRA